MIKKSLFMPILAALALTACSQSEEPGNSGNEGKDLGYVAVNIVQSNDAGTRAPGANTFENGSKDENYAEEGLFFIFNSDNSINGTAQRVPLSGEGSKDSPAVERIYNAVLVIDGAKSNDANYPTAGRKIVCVLNAPAGLETGVANLSDLTAKVDDYATGYQSNGKFLMTNSVYKEGDNAVVGALVTADNIKTSASAALANPVEIYVERVVAKVNVVTKSDNDGFANNGAKPFIDGEETNLDIVLTGLEIANIAKTSYLFKNINGISYSWAWDTTNKRSYWETMPTNMTYANQSYNQIVTTSKPGTGDFDIASAKIEKLYIQPNTSNQKTSVLVTGYVHKQNETDGLDIVYLKGGYFSPNEALKVIATEIAAQGYWKRTSEEGASTTNYSTLAPTDFEWVNKKDIEEENNALTDENKQTVPNIKDYEVIARVKSGVTNIFKKVGDTYSPATVKNVNDALIAGPGIARYYKDGKCYYYLEIDQTPAAKDNGFSGTDTFLGVVRNHVYKLTLNSIGGLGTPVFDPDDVIIPQRPEDETLGYLAARINVLKWKVVSQGVDFPGLQNTTNK